MCCFIRSRQRHYSKCAKEQLHNSDPGAEVRHSHCDGGTRPHGVRSDRLRQDGSFPPPHHKLVKRQQILQEFQRPQQKCKTGSRPAETLWFHKSLLKKFNIRVVKHLVACRPSVCGAREEQVKVMLL